MSDLTVDGGAQDGRFVDGGHAVANDGTDRLGDDVEGRCGGCDRGP